MDLGALLETGTKLLGSIANSSEGLGGFFSKLDFTKIPDALADLGKADLNETSAKNLYDSFFKTIGFDDQARSTLQNSLNETLGLKTEDWDKGAMTLMKDTNAKHKWFTPNELQEGITGTQEFLKDPKNIEQIQDFLKNPTFGKEEVSKFDQANQQQPTPRSNSDVGSNNPNPLMAIIKQLLTMLKKLMPKPSKNAQLGSRLSSLATDFEGFNPTNNPEPKPSKELHLGMDPTAKSPRHLEQSKTGSQPDPKDSKQEDDHHASSAKPK